MPEHAPRLTRPSLVAAGFAAAAIAVPAAGAIADFNQWTLVQDPAHPNMTAQVDTPSQLTLDAVGPVPNATDIGYQSVNANTPAAATAGYAFDPNASFAIAVDYDWSLLDAAGGSAIGLGIGEDGTGDQSAGVALAATNNTIVAASATARTTAGQTAVPISLGAPASGSLHVSYDAATGDITVGTGATAANSPSATALLPAATVYDLWNTDGDDDLLLVSLFLRSDDTLAPALADGSSAAVFSNFRVITGSPTAVPEPGSLALLTLGTLLTARRRRG